MKRRCTKKARKIETKDDAPDQPNAPNQQFGAPADLAQTVPMTESQVEAAMESLPDSQQACGDSVDLGQGDLTGDQEDEQGEEESLTDDEIVTPIICHDEAAYDLVKDDSVNAHYMDSQSHGNDAPPAIPKDDPKNIPKDVKAPSENEPAAPAASEPVPSPGVEEVLGSEDEGLKTKDKSKGKTEEKTTYQKGTFQER